MNRHIPAYNNHLHHLLKSAAYGGISRDRARGVIWVDGDTVTNTGDDPRIWGVSTLNDLGWLLWWPDTARMETCCLSPLGNEVLDAWDSQLWDVRIRRPFSSRPLSTDASLADVLGVSETTAAALRAAFTALDHTPGGTNRKDNTRDEPA